MGSLPVEQPNLHVFEDYEVELIRKPELGYSFGYVEPKSSFAKSYATQVAAESFLKITTPEEGLAFFTIYGPMVSNEVDDGSNPKYPGGQTEWLTFRDVQRWQKNVWRLRTATPLELKHVANIAQIPAKLGDILNLRYLIEPPRVEIPLDPPLRLAFNSARDIAEALRLTLQIERLQGIRSQFCALPDCATPFKFSGNRLHKYCSMDCAHKAAVRASRERAKKEREQ